VIIKLNNEKTPFSDVGCIMKNGKQNTLSLCYPNYPQSKSKLKRSCVLHEMCHTIGLEHEHCRCDRNNHVLVSDNEDHNFSTSGIISWGAYDYFSVMHYSDGAGLEALNRELGDTADTEKTLSLSSGDKSVIRRLYGKGKRPHGGDWHRACGPKCTDSVCSCGACKSHNGVNCGFEGSNSKGHWSCCMNTHRNSKCSSTHTGFWHMACSGDSCVKTSKIECKCGSCGAGCTVLTKKAHWSCCGQTILRNSPCKNSPYKIPVSRIF